MVSQGEVLYDFGSLLQQQFGLGDNKLTSLDLAVNGQTQRYGQLGTFAQQFDQTAQRSYTEEGYYKTDTFNPHPKQLDILMQTPDITVFVKKRAFASLAENFRIDLMDNRERLLLAATKLLFQNKCNQIQSYERLTKISQVAIQTGGLSDYLLPALFALTDNITQLPNVLGGGPGALGAVAGLSDFASIVNQVRQIVNLANDNYNTTWITNVQDSFSTTFGEGTGVIELTNITSLNTTTSINFAGGSFNLNISDPYNLMLITNNDIENAISDAGNTFYNNAFFKLGLSVLNETIASNQHNLNELRAQRGVSAITFTVDANSFLGQPIVASIDNIGYQIPFSGGGVLESTFSTTSTSGVGIDPAALQGSSTLGQQGLSHKEVKLFGEIISELYNQVSLQKNAGNQTQTFNQDPTIKYVRKKLRLFYGGKPIIQVMDNIHVYIRSYKNIDTKIVGGLQSSLNGPTFMQSAANTINSIADAFNLNNNYNIEKAIYVGDNFPNWLWMIFRSWFISENDGAHVFAGIVDESQSSYNNGMHMIRVAGSDNAGYFKYGIANIKPSLDVYNGPLYDPLTPFDIQFDSITGFDPSTAPTLISENISLFTSAFVKYKNGSFAGIPPTQNSYMITDAERPAGNKMRRVFYDPEGMVYRWKEGIGALVLFGDSIQSPAISSAPTITQDPFAGQDIMNVLSLLISGEPYNYATYYNAVAKWDSYPAANPLSGVDASSSYFRSLQNNLKYRNLLYGSFIPFKSLTVDPQVYSKMLYGQLSVQGFNAQLQSLLQQRASLADKLVWLQKAKPADAITSASALQSIDIQIAGQIGSISSAINQSATPVSLVGQNITFDSNASLDVGSQITSSADVVALQKKIAFLTRRLSWKVRANQDVNYLIVDDTYDKDMDIQAFEKAFVNPELYKSDYESVNQTIEVIAKKMQFEVFANTQGHIEVRNPKYNRMPSSVYTRMFQLNKELGIQVFPQFLEDLYVNQIESLQSEIETIEDQIRLYCLTLGNITDNDCTKFIDGDSSNSLATSYFILLSEENTGKIFIGDLSKIDYQAHPEKLLNIINSLSLTGIQFQASQNAFDVAVQANIVLSSHTSGALNISNQFSNLPELLSSSSAQSRATVLINRIQSKTGQTFDMAQITGASTQSQFLSPTNMDILNIVNKISVLVSQRQSLLVPFVNALKGAQEAAQSNADAANQTIYLLGNSPNANPPTIIASMIEDETYNDLGPNSGSRFIIKNHDIISWDLSDKRPPFTSIEVTGRIGDNVIANSQLPSGLNVFENGGNAFTTTAAVDYDLWRQYGISKPTHIDAPFLNNPDTQCPIYAVSLLNQARFQISSGTITVTGNEYQQPGEVIYIENLDKLFYIESVSHNFDYGQSFTTHLAVGYGHNPGEFIPTPLDVIGKIIYKNKDITTFAHKRQGNVFNQQYVGTIIGNVGQFSLSPSDDIVNGRFGDANKTTMSQIITSALPLLAAQSSNFAPILELRVFYNTNSKLSTYNTLNGYTTSLASALAQYLNGATSLSGLTNPSLSTQISPTALSAFKSQIKVVQVDTNPGNTASVQEQSSTQKPVDDIIYNYIVDCWILLDNPNVDKSAGEFRYPSTGAYSAARSVLGITNNE